MSQSDNKTHYFIDAYERLKFPLSKRKTGISPGEMKIFIYCMTSP